MMYWENKKQQDERKQLSFVNDMTAEEQALALAAAKVLGVKLHTGAVRLPGFTRIIKATTACTMCKTETVQYVKMVKYSDKSWRKEADLREEELADFQTVVIENISGAVSNCWNCKTVLLELPKEELVKMLFKLHFTAHDRSSAWKALQLSAPRDTNKLEEDEALDLKATLRRNYDE
jgi:hypothetical protein